MNSTRTLAAAALLALALAGCGDGGEAGSGPASSAPAGTAAATSARPTPTTTAPASSPAAEPSRQPGQDATADPTVDLTIEFSADGGSVTDTYQLVCAGTDPLQGEGVPDPGAACAQLAEHGTAPFVDETSSGGISCTQQIAGMQRATVAGSVDGQPVEAAFSLTDGCQISRWQQLTGLLGPAEGTL